MDRLAFIMGNVAAQLYLIMVFVTALTTGNHWSLYAVIMAEGVAALGYQCQLLENETPVTIGTLTLATTVVSWVAAFAAGVMLV
jgi:hypothetical protein